jgi:virginiamycin B lyase
MSKERYPFSGRHSWRLTALRLSRSHVNQASSSRHRTSRPWITAKGGMIAMLVLILCAGILALEAPPASASTSDGTVTDYTNPNLDLPGAITTGPDGALWFTNLDGGSNGKGFIGRIATDGDITDYTNAGIEYPMGITTGPDGALWFTNADAIGRITTDGVITIYPDPSILFAEQITAGPDGALWFANDEGGPSQTGSIGRITTDGVITNYTDPSISGPNGITVGPDGALWFTNDGNRAGGGSIGRITTSGVVSNYTDPSIDYPHDIVSGPDGALWFTNSDGGPTSGGTIGRITTSGVVSDYTDPGIHLPLGITSGPDGALWFTNFDNNRIGRITVDGTVSTFADPGIDGPEGITTGPDGALWFANYYNNSIGRTTSPATITTASVVPRVAAPGSSVTYSSTVAPTWGSQTPTGTVTFSVGSTGLCIATLSAGDGSCSATNAPVGTDTVTATYSGDSTFPSSSGTTSLTVLAPTTTAPSVSPTSTNVGSSVSYSATVAPASISGTPTGTVRFGVGSTDLCTATLSAGIGSCSATNAPIGTDVVTATYSGDSIFASSSGTTPLTVLPPVPPVVSCSKLSGNVSSSVHFRMCAPLQKRNRSASAPGTLFTSGGTLTWKPSGQTSSASLSSTSPGRGVCRTNSIELDVTGTITGGTSTYTHTDDPVTIRLCETDRGAVKLVPGSQADF